jgi:hypothetical protein
MESIRVDATRLAEVIGKTVRVIGQLKSLDGENAGQLDSNGQISFTSNSDTLFEIDHWYEVIAIVKPDLSLNILQSFDFGTKFNAHAANKLIEVIHKHPELYHSIQ